MPGPYAMRTAPMDTDILAMMPDRLRWALIRRQADFLDAEGRRCAGWVWVDESPPPACWTDGVCWQVNEDDEASIQPVAWVLP